jgi:hypothetical protein
LCGDDLLVGRLAPDDNALRELQTDGKHGPLADPVPLRVIVKETGS